MDDEELVTDTDVLLRSWNVPEIIIARFQGKYILLSTRCLLRVCNALSISINSTINITCPPLTRPPLLRSVQYFASVGRRTIAVSLADMPCQRAHVPTDMPVRECHLKYETMF